MSTYGQPRPRFETIGIPEGESNSLKAMAERMLDERDESVRNLRCASTPIGCGKEISPEQFREYSDLDKKEYAMSGLCKSCQDSFFGPDAD